MTKGKSQNLSIMMTDIQGYTDTSSHSSRDETVKLVRRHNQLMVPVIGFYGGHIVKSIGDAFLCTFESATDAVVCAIIIQLLLKDYNQRQKDEHARMKLRVVVNTGDVSLEANDIYGDAVNITARMEGLPCFPGGSIGISEATHLLMNRNEIVAEKIGPQTLKGIPDPITVFSVPLEKQKLTTIPLRLSQLVEKVVCGEGTGEGQGAMSSKQLAEWSSAVNSYLKEQNWGENIASISQKMGSFRADIAKTFGGPSLVESGVGKIAVDAPVTRRLQSFLVDAVIITIAGFALSTGWWVVKRVVFGRSPGLIAALLGLVIEHPYILAYFYFVIFWKVRGASLGQIALKTAVVTEDGSAMTWSLAFKRGAIFMLSTLLLGAGAATLFTDKKRTIYDEVCKTRVIG